MCACIYIYIYCVTPIRIIIFHPLRFKLTSCQGSDNNSDNFKNNGVQRRYTIIFNKPWVGPWGFNIHPPHYTHLSLSYHYHLGGRVILCGGLILSDIGSD